MISKHKANNLKNNHLQHQLNPRATPISSLYIVTSLEKVIKPTLYPWTDLFSHHLLEYCDIDNTIRAHPDKPPHVTRDTDRRDQQHSNISTSSIGGSILSELATSIKLNDQVERCSAETRKSASRDYFQDATTSIPSLLAEDQQSCIDLQSCLP
ncbi:hypothetical protein BJX99DRAFT_219708 [Aspergillus californicus]